jgi:hypothetical protein
MKEKSHMFHKIAATLAAATIAVTGLSVMPASADTQSAGWGLDRIDQTSRTLNGQYTYNDFGNGTNIYVVDSGVASSVGDLAGRVSSSGISFVADQPSPSDCFGSGTKNATAAAGTTYGVAKQATIVPVRVADCSGHTTVPALTGAVNWVTTIHKVLKDRAVLLLNTFNVKTADKKLALAVSNAIKAGVPVVIGAGDQDRNPCGYAPYTVGGALVVGASDPNDVRAQFANGASNLGPCVDLYAPGVNIPVANRDNTGTVLSSTSVSAAFASGWLARYFSANPTGNAAEALSQIIVRSNRGSGNQPAVLDAGAKNPNALLYAAPSLVKQNPPAAPSGVVAFANGNIGEVNVAWSTPTSVGSAPLNGYKITVSPATGVNGGATRTVGVVNQYAFTGLSVGVAYRFSVVATTSAGSSSASKWSTPVTLVALPASAPQSPTISVTRGLTNSLTIGWLTPVSNGGSPITGYYVVLTGSDNSIITTVVTGAAAIKAQFDNLNSSVTYSATIYAMNKAGNGAGAITGRLHP